jgi:hypothetical protein
MEKSISELDSVIMKLVRNLILCPFGQVAIHSRQQKQFRRINAVIDNMESLLFEAHKTKGYKWVQNEPLWVTWPMEKFGRPLCLGSFCRTNNFPVTSVPDILIPYHRSLNMHIEIVDLLRPHSVSFDASRDALTKWLAQPCLEEDGWEAKWEDLCTVEVYRWDGT